VEGLREIPLWKWIILGIAQQPQQLPEERNFCVAMELLSRILNRRRPEEKYMKLSIVVSLQERYEHLAKHLSDVLRHDCKTFDIETDREKLFEKIFQSIKEMTGF
jgi:deoxyadenosine/deoxycytidine kinase